MKEYCLEISSSYAMGIEVVLAEVLGSWPNDLLPLLGVIARDEVSQPVARVLVKQVAVAYAQQSLESRGMIHGFVYYAVPSVGVRIVDPYAGTEVSVDVSDKETRCTIRGEGIPNAIRGMAKRGAVLQAALYVRRDSCTMEKLPASTPQEMYLAMKANGDWCGIAPV